MRKLFLLLILNFAGIYCFSQFRFGIQTGVSSTSIKLDETVLLDVMGNSKEINAGDANIGFHIGLVGHLQIFSVYLRPELYFSNSGGELKVKDVQTNVETIVKQSYNKIDVPLIIGRAWDRFRVDLGPVASFLISSKSGLDDLEIREDAKKTTWGYQVGCGFDFWKLGLGLRYEGNLSKLGDQVTFANKNFQLDSRNPKWMFSLIYYFNKYDD